MDSNGGEIGGNPPGPTYQEYAAPIPQTPPWEYPEEMGGFKAMLLTIQRVNFEPIQTFRYMRPTGNLLRAYIYYLVISLILFGIGLAIQKMLGSWSDRVWEMLQGMAGNLDVKQESMTLSRPVEMLLLGVAICWVFVHPLITAALLHLSLLVTGGRSQPFDSTFRLVCYAAPSSDVWTIIPCIGAIIWMIWYPILLIIGLAEQNNISKGRAVLVVSLPGLLFCACGFCASFYYLQSLSSLVGS